MSLQTSAFLDYLAVQSRLSEPESLTEETVPPEVVDVLRSAAANARAAGRKNILYEDYPPTEKGANVSDLVSDPEKREAAGYNILQLALSEDPVIQAAFTIGRAGNLKTDDKGRLVIEDPYDFSYEGDISLDDDLYSMIRKTAGKLQTRGATNRIVIGTPMQVDGSHKVQAGDTLGKIAKMSGYSVEELMAANNIKNANKIRVGQKIVMPTATKSPDAPIEKMPEGTTVEEPRRPDKEPETNIYEVKSGDTLSEIAEKAGVSLEDIVANNNIQDVNKIKVGQELQIPTMSTEEDEDALNTALAGISSTGTSYYPIASQNPYRRSVLESDDPEITAADDAWSDLMAKYK